MNKGLLFFQLLVLFAASSCNAKPSPPAPTAAAPQILTPVTWTWKAEATGKGEYKLTFTAKIDKNWHTYGQYIGDKGPVPTKISFDEKNKDVQLIGKTTENGPKVYEGHDPVFDMPLKYFEVSMVCEQKIKVLKDTKLKGTIEFM